MIGGRSKFWFLLIVSLAGATLIGWVDTRPTWDDAGITAGAIVGLTVLLGAAMPGRAAVWALAVGGLVSVFDVVLADNYVALFSLLLAFVGSYVGAFIRRAIDHAARSKQVE